jgi:hypothetical protein
LKKLENKLETAWDTAKELPGCLYEDFSSGKAEERLATFFVAAEEGVEKRAKEVLKGVVQAVTHPVETIENKLESLNYTLWHPWETLTESAKDLYRSIVGLEAAAEELLELAADDPDQFAVEVRNITGGQLVDAIVNRVSGGASDMLETSLNQASFVMDLGAIEARRVRLPKLDGTADVFKKLKAANGLHRHHMPANIFHFLPRPEGGAISIPDFLHRRTADYKGRQRSKSSPATCRFEPPPAPACSQRLRDGR